MLDGLIGNPPKALPKMPAISALADRRAHHFHSIEQRINVALRRQLDRKPRDGLEGRHRLIYLVENLHNI